MLGKDMAVRRRFIEVGVAVALVGAGVWLAGLMWTGPRWSSDPQTVRPWSPLPALLAPTNPPPFVLDTNAWAGLLVESTTEGTSITYPTAVREEVALRWRLVRADRTLSATLDGGRVSLAYVGIGYREPGKGEDEGYAWRVPGQFFGPDLKPLNEGDQARLQLNQWERTLRYREGCPALKIGLEMERIEGFRLLGLQVFDGRTQARLDNWGLSHGGWTNCYYVETAVALWHRTPVDLVVDLAIGPPEITEFASEPRVIHAFPMGAVMLATLADGAGSSWGTSSDGRIERFTLRGDASSRDPRCAAVFACLPTAHPVPFDLDLLDPSGEPLPSRGSGSSGRMLVKEVGVAAAAVAKVRLRYFPNHYRIVFRLPFLPGLPESNNNPRNLFDIRVPWMSLRDQYAVRSWLERTLQMEIQSRMTPSPPTGAFPMVLTDTTPSQVLETYLSLFGPGATARVRPEEERLVITRPWWIEWRDGAWKWLRSKFK